MRSIRFSTVALLVTWPAPRSSRRPEAAAPSGSRRAATRNARPGFATTRRSRPTRSPRAGSSCSGSHRSTIARASCSSLNQGVTANGVTLFTPLSLVSGSSNNIYAIDNDTGNVYWQRHFDIPLPAAGTIACPGGITAAATRTVSVTPPAPAAGRAGGGGGRGGGGYRSVLGEPGEGIPATPRGGGAAGRTSWARRCARSARCTGSSGTGRGWRPCWWSPGRTRRGRCGRSGCCRPRPRCRGGSGSGGRSRRPRRSWCWRRARNSRARGHRSVVRVPQQQPVEAVDSDAHLESSMSSRATACSTRLDSSLAKTSISP